VLRGVDFAFLCVWEYFCAGIPS